MTANIGIPVFAPMDFKEKSRQHKPSDSKADVSYCNN